MRAWHWDIERNYTGQYRNAERIFDRREIKNIKSIQITDGLNNEDDTIKIATFDSIIPTGVLMAEHDGRLFGPYDVEQYAVEREDKEQSISGRVDRQFQDTFTNDYFRIIFGEPERPGPFGVGLAGLPALLTSQIPYNIWSEEDSGIYNLITSAVASSNLLSDVKRSLSDYNLTVFADTTLHRITTGEIATLVRRTGIRSIYPTQDSVNRKPLTYNYNILKEDNRQWAIRHVISEPELDITSTPQLVDDTRYAVPDVYNDEELYELRRIALGHRGLNEDVYLAHAGTLFPTKFIDHTSYLAPASAAYIDINRWALQNTAARASILIPFDRRILPNTIVHLNNNIVRFKNWRVVSATHIIDSVRGAFTRLNLALWQGYWKRYTGGSFRPARPGNIITTVSPDGDEIILSWSRGSLSDPIYTGEWKVTIRGNGAGGSYTLMDESDISQNRVVFEVEPANSTEMLREGVIRKGYSYAVGLTAKSIYGRTSLEALYYFIA